MAVQTESEALREAVVKETGRLILMEQQVHESLDAMGAPQFENTEFRVGFRLQWVQSRLTVTATALTLAAKVMQDHGFDKTMADEFKIIADTLSVTTKPKKEELCG